ncbi:MAG TPA: hypothetical protein DE036_05305, partial [Actinobacteria bacterium]|nr:hypothetical protein [Actinomycetota bacterium]
LSTSFGFFIVAVYLSLALIWTVPSSMTISELAEEGLLYNSYELSRNPTLMFNTTSASGWPQHLYVRDDASIQRLLKLVQNKRAMHLSDVEYEKIQPLERSALSLNFDEKLSSLIILDDGRVTFSIYSSHYRNKSRLHWLRWKIDGFGTRYTGVTFITEPDAAVIKEARGLFQAAKPAQ